MIFLGLGINLEIREGPEFPLLPLEEKKMKKLFSVFLAVAFALSMVGVAVAADNAAKAPAKAAAPAAAPAPAEKKAAPAGEKKASKAKSQQVTGTVEAVDAAAGTITVKGKKGNVDLKAGEKVKLGDFKVGDKVVVKYSDGNAQSVKAVKAKKAEAKPAAAAPAPAKPAAATPAPAAPPAAAAPAPAAPAKK